MLELHHHLKAITLSTLLLLSNSSIAADLITQVEGITEYRLTNGLQVLLFPDQTKETITVNVTYRVGSKHENYGETGMAHLLEHLLFKGTPSHKNIPKELSSHGARPNGTTWTDRTNYFETFSASPENIDWALSLESSRMVESFIAQSDLESEMTVVRNELERGENSPFSVTLNHMLSTAYSWHNYGKTTIGARSDIENVSIERLKAFYKKYYQPDNATLVVAGRFEEKALLKRIEHYFGAIPKPKRTLPPLYTLEPAQEGEKSVTVRRLGDIQLLGTMYHIPAGSHPDTAAIDVLSQILSNTPSGRLHKNLVEKQLASQSFGFNFQWKDPGVAIFMTQVDKNNDLEKTRRAALNTIENIKQYPITDKETERAKRKLLKNIETAFNSSETMAKKLSEWLAMGDWRLFFLHRDRIAAVNTADVQRVAESYLQRNNRTEGQFIPSETSKKVNIPLVSSVADMLKAYKGREAITQGENFIPSFDNIDNRTQRTQLSSGAKVALLSKKTRGETVAINIKLNLGNQSSLQGMRTIGKGVAALLMRGTKHHSREELQDNFDKLKTSVHVDGGATQVTIAMTTTRENIEKSLTLMIEVLKNPAFDPKEFKQYKVSQKVAIEKKQQDPQDIAFNEYARKHSAFEKDDPRYVPTFKEALSNNHQLNLKDLKSFHQRFFGASFMNIAVVGDFNNKQLLSTLEDLLSQWPTPEHYQRIPNPYKRMLTSNKVFNTPHKENATFIATTTLPLSDHADDAPALELVNYLFGGGFLNSRLANRLRQQEGLSYSAGSFIRTSAYDERTAMGVYAICAPQNLSKVETGFKEELARLLKDGFSDQEIDAAKSGLLQGKKVSRAQDKELADKLSDYLILDRSIQWDKQHEDALKGLNRKDLKEFVNRYLNVDDFSIIKAGDVNQHP